MALFTQIKARLNIQLRDTDNGTFNDAEKTEALTNAIMDNDIAIIEEVPLTFVNSTRSYTLDSTVRAVYSIGIDSSGGNLPVSLGGDTFSFNSPTLTFGSAWATGIPNNSKLYITQLRKLGIGDDIPDPLVDLVICLAIMECTDILANGKVNRFLRNDTSLSEIQARGQMAERKAARLRRGLANRRFVEV